MQFIALDNFKKLLVKSQYTGSTPFVGFTDTDNTYRNFSISNYNFMPIPVGNGTKTGPDANWIFPFASGYDSFDTDKIYQVPNVIGTTSVYMAQTANGGILDIEITATSGSSIKSLFFCRKFGWGGSTAAEAVVFALKLDKPLIVGSSGKEHLLLVIDYFA